MPTSLIGPAIGLAGSMMQSSAAGDAADAQAAAANNAAAVQKQIYNQNRDDLAPYRSTGYGANSMLAALMGIPVDRQTLMAQLLPQFTTGDGNMMGAISALAPAGKKQNAKKGATPMPVGTQTKGYTFKDASGNIIMDANGLPVNLNKLPKDMSMTYGGLAKQTKGDVTDWAGLNAALDAKMQALNSGDSFGSLAKPFGLEDFQADPGYAFRQSEGEKGLNRSLAAQGGLLSGAAMKAASRFNQDLASQEFGNAFARDTTNKNNLYSRLAGLSNQGMGATNNTASAGQNYANQYSDLMTGIGSARANAGINQGYFMNQGLQGLFGGSQYGNGVNWGQGGSYSYQPGSRQSILWNDF